jgi:hypothetical protein
VNVFMIDDRIPLKAMGAGYPRANALLHALLPRCERLAFYPLVFPVESADNPHAELDARIDVLSGRGKHGLALTLQEYAQRGFEVMWVSRPENMAFVGAVLEMLPGMRERWKIVYDAEAVYAPRTQQMFALRGTPLDPDDYAELIENETALAGRADILVSVSVAEARTLHTATGRPTYVLGFTSIPQATPAPFGARRDFGFVGGIRPDSPNEDSLLWYAANVMHEISARTGAMLRVVGYIDSQPVLSYGGSEMHIHGPVPDLQAFFDHIRVFIAPTRFAAGLPQKLIDAASAGVPIVATSVLADALGWRDGAELLVADGAHAFTAACVRLYGSAKLWNALRARGLEAVRAGYGPGVFESELERIVAAIHALHERQSREQSLPSFRV